MRVFRNIILILFALLLQGCMGKIKEVELTSAKVLSVTPRGLSSATVLLEVGVHNPGGEFQICDLQAQLKHRESPIIDLSSDTILVEARLDKLYKIALDGKIAEGFNFLSFLQVFANEPDTKDFTLSIKAKLVLPSGLGKDIEYNDIAIDQLIEDFKL